MPHRLLRQTPLFKHINHCEWTFLLLQFVLSWTTCLTSFLNTLPCSLHLDLALAHSLVWCHSVTLVFI